MSLFGKGGGAGSCLRKERLFLILSDIVRKDSRASADERRKYGQVRLTGKVFFLIINRDLVESFQKSSQRKKEIIDR